MVVLLMSMGSSKLSAQDQQFTQFNAAPTSTPRMLGYRAKQDWLPYTARNGLHCHKLLRDFT